MRTTKLTTRGAAIMGAIALIATGCGDEGGGDGPVEAAEPAVIPAAVAEKLAKRSDEVAAKLEEGELCDAAHEADKLMGDVSKAGNEIPAELRDELEGGAQQLVDTVNCPEKPEKEKKEEEKHKEDEDDGGYDDEEIFGEGDGDSAPGNSENAPGHNKGN